MNVTPKNIFMVLSLALAVSSATFSNAWSQTMSKTEFATFAAGCFWCVESEFQAIPGVKSVISGYTGGHVENPNYRQVTGKQTGHVEAVRIEYDPTVITYEELLKAFWWMHDPTQTDGQGVDIGPQYMSVIFYENESQKIAAEASKKGASNQFKNPIVTRIEPVSTFYEAENYHQDYYSKKGIEYDNILTREDKKQRHSGVGNFFKLFSH